MKQLDCMYACSIYVRYGLYDLNLDRDILDDGPPDTNKCADLLD